MFQEFVAEYCILVKTIKQRSSIISEVLFSIIVDRKQLLVDGLVNLLVLTCMISYALELIKRSSSTSTPGLKQVDSMSLSQ